MTVDDDARALHDVLHREAARLYPGVGPARTSAHERLRLVPGGGPSLAHRRRVWAPVAAAAAVLALVAGGLAIGLPRRGEDAARVATPTSVAPTTSAGRPALEGKRREPAAPSTMPARAVATYWVGGERGSLSLFREFRPGATGVVAAVTRMLDERPLDPDLRSVWRPAGVRSAGTSGPAGDAVVAVDVDAAAFSARDVDTEQARIAVQQLVYTATAAVPGATSVRLTVDGRTGYRAWGRTPLASVVRRDVSALAPIRILSPQQGDELPAGRVEVTGTGYAFEGMISWELSLVGPSGDARLLRAETIRTRGDGVAADFAVPLDLPDPGRYRFVAYEVDPAGSRRRLHADSKEFTVR